MSFAIYKHNYFIFTQNYTTMKKYFLLFAAGGLLTLASCGGETKPTESPVNTDSIEKAKVDSATNAMKAANDSTVAAATQAAKDSMAAIMLKDSIANAEKVAAAAKHGKTTAKKVETHKPTTGKVTPPPPPPTKSGGMRGSSDQNSSGGMRSHSDQNNPSGGGMRSHSDSKK
jgi:hypothetical protein